MRLPVPQLAFELCAEAAGMDLIPSKCKVRYINARQRLGSKLDLNPHAIHWGLIARTPPHRSIRIVCGSYTDHSPHGYPHTILTPSLPHTRADIPTLSSHPVCPTPAH